LILKALAESDEPLVATLHKIEQSHGVDQLG
jgi:hypothetical protein